MLELALSPYDVLRLKNNLGLNSNDFLEKYAIVEQDEEQPWPTVYLGMVDDGAGTCPFVTAKGCSVYPDRPGACRTYPVGRGAYQDESGARQEIFVLLEEPHCQGFQEAQLQNIPAWNHSQEVVPYNLYNDAVMPILHLPALQNGRRPDKKDIDKMMLALYDLDRFRAMLFAGNLGGAEILTELQRTAICNDDAELLLYSIQWLTNELFAE